MAFTNLNQLTLEEFERLNITPFGIQPIETTLGDPDSNVSIQLNGWVGENVLAFTVTNEWGTVSTLNIDTVNALTIDVNVNNGSTPSNVTYWTVETGSGDASGDNWIVSYQVRNSNKTNTGTYKFAKGKTGDDSY